MDANEAVLGIDIGGTNLRLGLVDRACRLEGFEIGSSEVLGGGDCLSALTGVIRGYCARHLDGRLPRAVSIGFPSTIDRQKRTVLSTPNLPGMNGLPVVETLEKALGITVLIDRDVNLLLLSDMRHFGLPPRGIVIGCYFGTGLGNAICINGETLSGKNGVAGELGHVPVIGCKRVCGCGNEGCLETLASGKNLTELWQRLYPEEPLGEIFLRHGDEEPLRDFVDMLAAAAATEINILDPDCVIAGGGVPQMKGFPLDLFHQRVLFHCRKPYPGENLNLLMSEGRQESGVLGAGIAGWQRTEKEAANS